MTRIAVGSRSQYKIDAASDAVHLVFADEVEEVIVGINVASGVSAQPMSNEESIQGARNRARGAIAATGIDVAIGIENGLTEIEGIWFANTWIVAINAHGREGIASTVLRPVPSHIMSDVLRGMELSDAVRANVPDEIRERYSGLIGIITNGVLNRHDVLRDGIVVALSDLILPEIY